MSSDNTSKRILLSVLGVAILVAAVVGITFAAFSYTKTGTVANTITTGAITMSYTEPTNGITLTNALPTTDDTGKKLTGTGNIFEFNVAATITGTTTINYAITASKDSSSTLPDTGVKVYLTSVSGTTETQVLAPTLVSALPKTSSSPSGAPNGQYTLKTGSYTASKTESYRLRMWVANTYSTLSKSQTYKLRVNVYGSASAK